MRRNRQMRRRAVCAAARNERAKRGGWAVECGHGQGPASERTKSINHLSMGGARTKGGAGDGARQAVGPKNNGADALG